MKINLLAIAAHPDDVELSCAGTLIQHSKKGFTTGIIDLTAGEMGTRGTTETRKQEAQKSAEIMGLSVRENLGFPDSFFTTESKYQLEIIKKIRQYQPDIILTNAVYDRHPDHTRGASLVEEAFFKAGLQKLITKDNSGSEQEKWRPKKLYHVIQSVSLEPDLFVDISDSFDEKMEAIKAYKTQFYDPKSEEPQTYISKPEFMDMIASRAMEYGHRIGVKYAEGFTTNHALGVKDLYHLL